MEALQQEKIKKAVVDKDSQTGITNPGDINYPAGPKDPNNIYKVVYTPPVPITIQPGAKTGISGPEL